MSLEAFLCCGRWLILPIGLQVLFSWRVTITLVNAVKTRIWAALIQQSAQFFSLILHPHFQFLSSSPDHMQFLSWIHFFIQLESRLQVYILQIAIKIRIVRVTLA